MNLIFLGPPGSGKGTQAKRLAEKASLRHLSTGDLLRDAVKEGTELGNKAKTYMEAGELVPDSIIIGLIEEKRNGGELDNGFILDGFPRTIPQAEALDEMFARAGVRIDHAVLLNVEDDEIVRRLSGRMYCSDCQTPYNYPNNMPKQEGICDRCGGGLVRRPDDEPEVVKNRLEVYKKQTRPIEDYYRRQSLLMAVPGVGSPDEIFVRITGQLGVS
jgi:adenylate kinase